MITMMENIYVFIKKYISKHKAKRRIFILQEAKNSNAFEKTLLKKTSNAIFNMKKVVLDES